MQGEVIYLYDFKREYDFYLSKLHVSRLNPYAIWTGIGAVGAVALGIVLFGDPATWPRLLCVALILIGIVGLKLTAS